MQCHFQDLIAMSLDLIKKYGSVDAFNSDYKNQTEIRHDFIFFCFTKGTKSLEAIDILLTAGYTEDAKILARSAYECYLNGSFIIAFPEKIDLVVAAKVGAYAGYYEHPLSKKAKKSIRKWFIL